MTSRDLPTDGGIIIKWGATTAQAKAREFHLERTQGASSIVYKTYKLLAKFSDNRLLLDRNFFVKHVRAATETETQTVLQFAKASTIYGSTLSAKRCFDVDLFDPNFLPAVGPTKLKSITVFATPDTSLGDIWTYMSGLMMEQGVFAPSPDDPDEFVVVKVIRNSPVANRRKSLSTESLSGRSSASERSISVDSMIVAPKEPGHEEQLRPIEPVRVEVMPPGPRLKPKLSTVDADILLSSLPLPPVTDLGDLQFQDENDN